MANQMMTSAVQDKPLMNRFWTLLIAVTIALSISPTASAQGERILSFVSEVEVHQNGSLTVTERIRVRAEGDDIKRGIYRDFPTQYKDRMGNRYNVGFEILGVERDGAQESYHTELQKNGLRIYFGRSDYFLPTGEYTYTFRYRTTRQLGFFEDHDELYWNVTGNGWDFPIDYAACYVRLPGGLSASRDKIYGYTGPMGSKEGAYSFRAETDGRAFFETTRPLGTKEGLTIVIEWPKGYVHEPSFQENFIHFVQDNSAVLIATLGFILLLGYYLIAWACVGVDPPPGVIFPRFAPPDNISPAASRYLTRMSFDSGCVAAALINMAVKGYLKIIETDGVYNLEKTSQSESDAKYKLTPEEKALYSHFFRGRRTFKLSSINHSDVSAAMKACKEELRKAYRRKYFFKNTYYHIPGILIAFFTLGFVLLSNTASPITWGVAIGTFLITVFVFWYLLKAPTVSGRKVMDSIDGFKMYLSTAEKDDLDRYDGLEPAKAPAPGEEGLTSKPEETPKLFERFLPYALALGVSNEWSRKFVAVLTQGGRGSDTYYPTWYSGRPFSASSFGSSFGSTLSSTISSSSTAPGSSSGGGGGGSSGGGGGGGGGGGW